MVSLEAQWLDGLKKNTKATFGHYFRSFRDYEGFTGEALVQKRLDDLSSGDKGRLREVEDKAAEWGKHLRNDGLHDTSIALAFRALKSFMSHNNLPLGDVGFKLEDERVKDEVLPTPGQLLTMVELQGANIERRYLISGLAMSGLAVSDFLSLKWTDNSPKWGTIREQLSNGNPFIHIRRTRGKTSTRHDCFIGGYVKDVLHHLSPYENEGKLLTLSERQARRVVTEAGANPATGILVNDEYRFSPHVLRAFFIVTLGRCGSPYDKLADFWAGHRPGKMSRAYGSLLSSIEDQAALYNEVQRFLTPGGPRPKVPKVLVAEE